MVFERFSAATSPNSKPMSMAVGPPTELASTLVSRLVELCRASMADRSIEAGIDWDSVLIPVEVRGSGSASAGVAYYFKDGSSSGDLQLSNPREAMSIAQELCAELTTATGKSVTRTRVTILASWEAKMEWLGPRPVPGHIQHLGVWPDEDGYDGPVFEPEPLKFRRNDDELYRGSRSYAAVESLLLRIKNWYEANTPSGYLALNSGATPEELEALETDLGGTLPASVREAWLLHNGQQHERRWPDGFQWLSLDGARAFRNTFHERAGGGAGLIPVLRSDTYVGFVGRANDVGDDETLWLYDWDRSCDYRRAPSLAAFMGQLAEDLEGGTYVLQGGLILRSEEAE